MKNKTKINKWDLINLKAFSQQRKPSVKEKDNPQNGKKILANKDTYREFLFNTYKPLVQLNVKNKQPNKKSAKE